MTTIDDNEDMIHYSGSALSGLSDLTDEDMEERYAQTFAEFEAENSEVVQTEDEVGPADETLPTPF